MAALVQTFPQTGSATMLQTRPASTGNIIPMPQGQPAQQYGAQQQRHSFYGGSNGMPGAPAAYRSSQAPIQPYAFTSTPSLHTNTQRQHHHHQSTSSRPPTLPALPRMQSFDSANTLARISRQPASSSMVNLTSSTTSPGGRYTFGSRDDSSLPNQGIRRVPASPQSGSPYLQNSPSLPTFAQVASRSSPERYRRTVPRTVASPSAPAVSQGQHKTHSYGGNVSIDSIDYPRLPASSSMNQVNSSRRNSAHDPVLQTTDDMQLYRPDDAKRFRRRSMPSLDYLNAMTPHVPFRKTEESARSADKEKKRASAGTTSSHGRDGSSESVSSMSQSKNRRGPATGTTPASDNNEKRGSSKVSIPPRGSSDAANRLNTSAADSTADREKKAVASSSSVAAEQPGDKTKALPSHLESPAMRHLSAINQKGTKLRSKTSRLRRAFSFGSMAEFQNTENDEAGKDEKDVSGKLQKQPNHDETYDAEQARIAQRQEEAGIGNSIYAGAKIFSGSTDNLSISSTASSASIMIRKMGRGMKKSTRSLVGLFRPKSIIGSPSEASISEGSAPAPATTSPVIEATVSMVTAEAERERVNVSADVHSQAGGGTGFPRLERNSIDASRVSIGSDGISSSETENSASRKSIVGGERERAEVLAAVRKGILKNRSGASSPSRGPPSDSERELQGPPAINESPVSSAPSTPNDEGLGHKRTGSVAIGGEDYFVSALRLRQDRSGNSTPQGSMRRNATFSPRIVFYDTWPSQEYDRRGEIATCNRLTPLLAQQIKEELNSFKMEMEVHENSKIYTHFF